MALEQSHGQPQIDGAGSEGQVQIGRPALVIMQMHMPEARAVRLE